MTEHHSVIKGHILELETRPDEARNVDVGGQTLPVGPESFAELARAFRDRMRAYRADLLARGGQRGNVDAAIDHVLASAGLKR